MCVTLETSWKVDKGIVSLSNYSVYIGSKYKKLLGEKFYYLLSPVVYNITYFYLHPRCTAFCNVPCENETSFKFKEL
jgi:hypothetical protein